MPEAPAALPLFRSEAILARREPMHGKVAVLLPPGAAASAAVALSSLLLLGFALWLVEVPQRTPAVGVLMPPGGLVRVVAPRAGRVGRLLVREGDRVGSGQDLLVVTAGDGAVGEASLAHARLDSLHRELALQRALGNEERRVLAARHEALDEQLRGISAELERTSAESALQQARVELLADRRERVRKLSSSGNAASVLLEQATLDWLAARAAVEALRRQHLRIEQESRRVRAEREALALDASRREVEQAVLSERIARRLPDAEAQVGHVVRAPRAGVVARLMARPGQPVPAGGTLAVIRRGGTHEGDAALEAWLYVPSTVVGALRNGQPVELRFDDRPGRLLATRGATIRSVSSVALMPSDLDVPLVLSGPVFEIRATLDESSARQGGRRPLAPGTAVRAELVHRRYRLYEWLFRLQRDEVPTVPAPADA